MFFFQKRHSYYALLQKLIVLEKPQHIERRVNCKWIVGANKLTGHNAGILLQCFMTCEHFNGMRLVTELMLSLTFTTEPHWQFSRQ